MDNVSLPRMGNSLKSHGFNKVNLFIHNKKTAFRRFFHFLTASHENNQS